MGNRYVNCSSVLLKSIIKDERACLDAKLALMAKTTHKGVSRKQQVYFVKTLKKIVGHGDHTIIPQTLNNWSNGFL